MSTNARPPRPPPRAASSGERERPTNYALSESLRNLADTQAGLTDGQRNDLRIVATLLRSPQDGRREDDLRQIVEKTLWLCGWKGDASLVGGIVTRVRHAQEKTRVRSPGEPERERVHVYLDGVMQAANVLLDERPRVLGYSVLRALPTDTGAADV